MGLGQLSGKHVLCPLLLSEVKEILVQMSKALIGLKQKLCVCEREQKNLLDFIKEWMNCSATTQGLKEHCRN